MSLSHIDEQMTRPRAVEPQSVAVPFPSLFCKMLALGLSPAHLPAWSLDSLQCAVFAVSSIPPILSLPPNSLLRKALYPAPLVLISSAFLAPPPSLLRNNEEAYKYGKIL